MCDTSGRYRSTIFSIRNTAAILYVLCYSIYIHIQEYSVVLIVIELCIKIGRIGTTVLGVKHFTIHAWQQRGVV